MPLWVACGGCWCVGDNIHPVLTMTYYILTVTSTDHMPGLNVTSTDHIPGLNVTSTDHIPELNDRSHAVT